MTSLPEYEVSVSFPCQLPMWKQPSPKDKFFDSLLHIVLLNMAGKGKAKGRGRPRKVLPIVPVVEETPTGGVVDTVVGNVEKDKSVDSGEGRKRDSTHVDSGPSRATDSDKSKKVSKKKKRKESDDSDDSDHYDSESETESDSGKRKRKRKSKKSRKSKSSRSRSKSRHYEDESESESDSGNRRRRKKYKKSNLKAAMNLILIAVKVRRGKRGKRDLSASQTPAVSLRASLTKVRSPTVNGTAPYPRSNTTWQM